MDLKRCGQTKTKRDGVYWELVWVRYRTERRGPRRRVVSCILWVMCSRKQAHSVFNKQPEAAPGSWQSRFFDEEGEPEWVEVDTKRVRVEKVRDFGGFWLGLQISDRLDSHPVSCNDCCPEDGRGYIPWSTRWTMTLILISVFASHPVNCGIAEYLYERSSDSILGRGYRQIKSTTTGYLGPWIGSCHTEIEMEKHLKERLGEIFDLEIRLAPVPM